MPRVPLVKCDIEIRRRPGWIDSEKKELGRTVWTDAIATNRRVVGYVIEDKDGAEVRVVCKCSEDNCSICNYVEDEDNNLDANGFNVHHPTYTQEVNA